MDLRTGVEEPGEGVGGFYEGCCAVEEVRVDFVAEFGGEGEEAEGFGGWR